MRAYCVQTDIAWEQKKANFLRVRGMLRAAAVEPGSLVVLPEMFATGFSMNVDRIYEEERGGETEKFLCDIAGELRSTVVGGVVRRRADGKGLNCALVCAPGAGGKGQVASVYAKMHPFSFGEEAQHYAAGESVETFAWGSGEQACRCGLAVCYDLRFPELYRRQSLVGGAEVLVTIANWPVAREAHWVTLLQARAIENQAYVVGCNRVGRDAGNTYSGRSLIVGPRGEIVADAVSWERVISGAVDVAGLRAWRAQFPALKDARPL